MGLPTGLLLAKAGYKVQGYDIVEKKIKMLQNDILPFEEKGIEKLFQQAKKNFEASNTLKESDVFIITVPTPVTDEKTCDLSYVLSATQKVSTVLKDNNLVVLESTVSPGTTINQVKPILDKKNKNYLLSYVSEKAIPGNTIYEMQHNTRIIGGINKKSAEETKEIYKSFVKGDIYLTDTNTAETVKLMENTYRDVNIALANEFALILPDYNVNVWEAITLANHHPRVNIHKPGPGVGGHCISIDPWFLVSDKTRLIRTAREINDNMPENVIKIITNLLKDIKNPTITILGLAYKGNVDDIRESPAFKIKKIAENEGISVKIYDPLVRNYAGNEPTLEEAVKNSDCLVLNTDHDVFKKIDPKKLIMRHKNLIDTRNILDYDIWKKNGFNIKILGKESI
jgi:UDP-N-acetyl-D-mannosaminuronic acid dehydrogenase